MESMELCEPFFWEDPRFLFSFTWAKKSPKDLCRSELLNQVVFLLILWSSLAAVFVSTGIPVLKSVPIILFIVLALYILIVWYPLALPSSLKLGFEDLAPPGVPAGPVEKKKDESTEAVEVGELDTSASSTEVPPVLDGFENPPFTQPTASNPFMNVLVSEITGAPSKAPAASVVATDMKLNLDDFFRVQWSSDPTDVFGKSQSQREFYTVPGSTVPNDQGSYQNWLYKIPGKTCKEGGRENCLPGTDGAPLPWLNQDR